MTPETKIKKNIKAVTAKKETNPFRLSRVDGVGVGSGKSVDAI